MIKTTRRVKNNGAKPNTVKPEAVRIEAVKPAQPEISRISLELTKPEAKAVFVAGSFNEWKPEKTPLVPLGNGRWAGNLAVKPGRHEYLFVVDGQWVPDPNAKESVQNPFGGKNSVLIVSE
jgi:1,4-alpha-glucan branching enzyme